MLLNYVEGNCSRCRPDEAVGGYYLFEDKGIEGVKQFLVFHPFRVAFSFCRILVDPLARTHGAEFEYGRKPSGDTSGSLQGAVFQDQLECHHIPTIHQALNNESVTEQVSV